jgi:hypothetical protein
MVSLEGSRVALVVRGCVLEAQSIRCFNEGWALSCCGHMVAWE